MAIQIDTFVDSHCHMFTAADVPLHATISQNIHHPLVVLFGGVFAGLGFKNYEKFIKFFDQESLQNVEQIVGELKKALEGEFKDSFHVETNKLILTPLVMDFDRNGNVRKFEGQVERLINAAKAFEDKPPVKDIKVLPFIGLDPRKFVYRDGVLQDSAGVRSVLKSFLQERGVIDAHSDARVPKDSLENGDILGIKLYPPLGFHVYPDDVAKREAYLAMYELLAEYQIPVTVHCQRDSYNLASSDMETFTTPENWASVLGTNSTLAKLRLNLGHFGGEKEVARAVNWSDGGSDSATSHFATGVSHIGWTTEIIKLLKGYEHTYADISAFDYRNDQSCASLLWLLAYDESGKFDEYGEFALADKLMWGSDYPMILDRDYTSYQKFFAAFVKAIIDRDLIRERNIYRIPADNQIPLSPVELLKVLVGSNPSQFLFGES